MEKKHCLRYFTIADYEKEQKWINDMSRGGWNFVCTNGLIYTFEKGTPSEWNYKIDLPGEQMTEGEVEAYYRFMEECGIEVVHTFKMWRYLRKKAASGDFNTGDNTYAQLAMVNKAYGVATKLTNILLVLFAIIIVAAAVVEQFANGPFAEFMQGFATGVSTSAIVALSIILVPITRRLRLRMNELVEEMQVKG